MAGAGISGVTYYIYKDKPKKAFIYSIVASVLAGVSKEIYDNKFDYKDLVATTLGGLSVSFTVDITRNKRNKNGSKKFN